ncbi:MAG: DNA translocase FtsK 4TM domain-containing protein [Muribaculaceae bacterium]|nr:DNA translocase FtsK 4TM domain-containing protein [Muribaculaceae bacterium]
MSDYDSYRPEITYSEELPLSSSLDNKKEEGKKPGVKKINNKKSKKKKPKRQEIESKQPSAEKAGGRSFVQNVVEAFTGTSARILLGIFLGCFCIYLGVAFISYAATCVQDQSAVNTFPVGQAPEIANSAGEGGARLSEFLINETFGLGSFVIVFWLGALSLKLLLGRPKFKTVNFTIKCV